MALTRIEDFVEFNESSLHLGLWMLSSMKIHVCQVHRSHREFCEPLRRRIFFDCMRTSVVSGVCFLLHYLESHGNQSLIF